MGEKHLIAVPTAFNIYRVSDETLQASQGLMATMPAALVLEMLVLRGLAKVVARGKPFDLEHEKDDGEDFYAAKEYEPGVDKPDEPEQQDEDKLPGPWWTPDSEDEEEDGG